jgi:hypothetical protein
LGGTKGKRVNAQTAKRYFNSIVSAMIVKLFVFIISFNLNIESVRCFEGPDTYNNFVLWDYAYLRYTWIVKANASQTQLSLLSVSWQRHLSALEVRPSNPSLGQEGS